MSASCFVAFLFNVVSVKFIIEVMTLQKPLLLTAACTVLFWHGKYLRFCVWDSVRKVKRDEVRACVLVTQRNAAL